MRFSKLYVAAMEKNDRGKYEESNCLRESLVTLQRDLESEIDTIPPGCQEEIVRVMRRLDATLESCRTFPQTLGQHWRLGQLGRQQATMQIVGHENWPSQSEA